MSEPSSEPSLMRTPYRPLADTNFSATPTVPLSSGRALRPEMITRLDSSGASAAASGVMDDSPTGAPVPL
eukprot:scaffold57598_cov59-Phaeocystis_antarctica.AAC.7